MRVKKKSLVNQRKLLERKIEQWLPLRRDRVPPSGWLKAIRGALGLSTRQLASRLGVAQTAVMQFEKGEVKGTVSLETVEKIARAMNCTFVYAIVPDENFSSLESVLDQRAMQAAQKIVSKVDQTMRLEEQGISTERLADQVKELAVELKLRMDSSLWNTENSKKKPKNKRG